MLWPYIEDRCKKCPLAGKVGKPIQKGPHAGIRYIECLRDNEGAMENFWRIKGHDNNLWVRQVVELQHCLYDEEQHDYVTPGNNGT